MPWRKLPTDGTNSGRVRKPRIGHDLRHMLVLQPERVKLEAPAPGPLS